jgi:hypothetical protein
MSTSDQLQGVSTIRSIIGGINVDTGIQPSAATDIVPAVPVLGACPDAYDYLLVIKLQWQQQQHLADAPQAPKAWASTAMQVAAGLDSSMP